MERAPTPDGAGANDRMIVIKKTTVYNTGEVRIGLGRVEKAEYTDEAGAKRTGLVAEMDIFEPGDPPKERHVSAHAGQRFQAGKLTLYVEELKGGSAAAVHLRVVDDAGQ